MRKAKAEETEDKLLYPLESLKNFHVAKDNPDVRGWEVSNDQGRVLGVVTELIVDKEQDKVRYMVVEADDRRADAVGGKPVLVPIGIAVIDPHDDCVVLPRITQEMLLRLPLYDGRAVSRRHEQQVRQALFPDWTAAPSGDYHAHEYFDEGKFYRSRKPSNT